MSGNERSKCVGPGQEGRPQTHSRRGPERSPGRSSERWLVAALALLVLTAVAAAHWPVLSAQALNIDDTTFLIRSRLLQNPGWASAARVLAEISHPSSLSGYYEPLSQLSLMLDVTLGGQAGHLQPFHCTNLLLHLVNTALLTVLLYLLFERPWPAALAGLLFGVHPLTVEPVAWVWERKTLLAASFTLWCLIFYVRYTQRRTRGCYGAALAVFVLALLSKPTATPVPLLLLVMDYWPLRRLSRRAVLEKLPFLLLAGGSAAVTLLSTSHTAAIVLPGHLSPMQTVLRICYLLVFYLHQVFRPLNLTSVYSLPQPMTLSDPIVRASVIILLVLVALVAVTLRWTRAFVAGGLFFLVALLPTMGIVQYSWIAASDKYTYLPLVGLMMVAARLFKSCWRRPDSRLAPTAAQLSVIVVVLMVAAAAAVRGRHYLTVWRDSETLLRHMLSLAPNSAYLHTNMAVELEERGKLAEALPHARRATELQPDDPKAHYNLANVLYRQAQYAQAAEQYRLAIKYQIAFAEAHNNLAACLFQMGQFDEAVEQFRAAIALNPDYEEAHFNLAQLLDTRARPDEAIAEYQQVLRINPRHKEARQLLDDAKSPKVR